MNSPLIFVGKDVFQAKLQLVQDGVQFVQRQMMFAVFNPKEGLMGQADPLCKLSVGQTPSLFPQESCQIAIQIPPHNGKSAKSIITYG